MRWCNSAQRRGIMIQTEEVWVGDCIEIMSEFPDKCIELMILRLGRGIEL